MLPHTLHPIFVFSLNADWCIIACLEESRQKGRDKALLAAKKDSTAAVDVLTCLISPGSCHDPDLALPAREPMRSTRMRHLLSWHLDLNCKSTTIRTLLVSDQNFEKRAINPLRHPALWLGEHNLQIRMHSCDSSQNNFYFLFSFLQLLISIMWVGGWVGAYKSGNVLGQFVPDTLQYSDYHEWWNPKNPKP